MLDKGQDPKEYVMEVCKPDCQGKLDRLHRCETALKNMTHADPELSCMYPLRDFVTCLDGCVHCFPYLGSTKNSFTISWERKWLAILISNTNIQNHIIKHILKNHHLSSGLIREVFFPQKKFDKK